MAAAAVLLLVSSPDTTSASEPRGAAIFAQHCAECHGADGQGSDEGYAEPLAGDHSLHVLTRLIDRTMPQGAPELVDGEDARLVAEYVYREIYSLEARQRKGLVPAPRVELARLTVPQFRNAVADLVGRFTPPITADQPRSERPRGGRRRGRGPANLPREPIPVQPGLRAEYFQSQGMSKADTRQLERVDHRINFDFGTGSPAPNITADQFAIIWDGSVEAPESGYYEFRLRTQNGARLYLNDDVSEVLGKLRDDSSSAGQRALIDAWVGSGELREESARVYLLGGRRYPLRVEFFKYKEPTASVTLEWKTPHGSWDLLDHQFLSTAPATRTFVVETPFPADDRSLGYERGRSVSQEWHAAVTQAAIATADEIVERLPRLAGLRNQRGGDEEEDDARLRIKKFLVALASAAFRRPLDDHERQILTKEFFAEVPNDDTAVRRAVLWILSSPSFLYTNVGAPGEVPTQYEVAERLALSLWDSIPDTALTEAAASGQLATRQQVEAQARRMMNDPRARAKVAGFFRHWLELEEREIAKDRELFPEFDEQIVADLRRSLELFVDGVFWSEESDYRQLLQADYLLLNEPLLKLYGGAASSVAIGELLPAEDSDARVQPAPPPPPGDPAYGIVAAEPEFVPVAGLDHDRAGVLTHPYLLSALAYHNSSSPIHRGVFLTRKVIGRGLKAPPVAVAFKDDEFAADLTMREKVTQLTQDAACMGCHGVINPLGYALERYDAIGRWRTQDGAKPVDTISTYQTVDGEELAVSSARDVARYAVSSESAHRAFVQQLFQHLVKQSPAAYGSDVVDQLRLDFAAGAFNMRELAVDIAVCAARHGSADPAPPDPSRPHTE